jgi:hypothetical protein
MESDTVGERRSPARSFRLDFRKGNKYVIFTLVSFIVLLATSPFWIEKVGSRQLSFYESCTPGERLDTRWRPDLRVKYGKYSVLYFGVSTSAKAKPFPAEVKSLSELPFVYDAIQIMVDVNGIVEAKGWCGETTSISTRHGVYKGSSLNELKNYSSR